MQAPSLGFASSYGGSRSARASSSVAAMDDASLRVSDADREHAVVALREHLLAGRLTLEEFSERVEAALQARVSADLARIRADLPEIIFVDTIGSRRKSVRVVAALFSHVTRRGRFRLGGRAVAVSAFGDLDFDLRDATIDRRQSAVTAVAAFGNVDVYVPEGVNVDVGGIIIFGHRGPGSTRTGSWRRTDTAGGNGACPNSGRLSPGARA